MNIDNLVLHVATFLDSDDALRGWIKLNEEVDLTGLTVEGAVIVSRDSEGVLTMEGVSGEAIEGLPLLGSDAAVVVGLFAPPLLLSSAIDAGVEAQLTDLIKKHDETRMGADIARYLAPGWSSVVLIVSDQDLARVGELLTMADKTTHRVIDPSDYDGIREVVSALTQEGEGRTDSQSEAT